MYQLFLIPLQSPAIMAISYIMGSYLAGMGVFLASITVSGSLTYLLVNSCLRDRIVKRYQKNMLFRVIVTEVRKHPHKTSIMVRLMYIHVTLKNVSLSISGTGYLLFMFYYYCSAMIIGSLLVLTGIEFKKQQDKDMSIDGFLKADWKQKIEMILLPIMGILTLSFILFGVWYTHRKVKELKKKEAEAKKDVLSVDYDSESESESHKDGI